MCSSVLVDTMPVDVRNRYSSTYSTSFQSPSSPSYGTTRTPSATRKYGSSGLGSSYVNGTSYRPSSSSRTLPSGPGPLDHSGKKLLGYSVNNFKSRTSGSSLTSRNGPLKADHSTLGNKYDKYDSSTNIGYSTMSYRRPGLSSNIDLGTTRSSSQLSGRRSASLADLTADLYISSHEHPSSSLNTRSDRDFLSTSTTPRRNSYYRDADSDILGRVSRTSRNSFSVDRDYDSVSPSYRPRYTTKSVSRDGSPVRDIGMSSRKFSTDAREDSPPKSLSRQSSSSSLATGPGSKYNSNGKVGLRNLGNTCFMNCVIQCLSNTKPLLDYCLKDDYLLDISTGSNMKGALMKAYINLMQSMWKDKNESYISPNAFKTQIQKFAPRFMGYSQQDSQEFLRYLLEGLHEDVNKVTRKPKQIALEDEHLERKSDTEKAHEYWRAYLNFDNSKIVEIFVGQLKSELKFSSCNHRSVTFDPFWDLSLPLSKNRSEVNLEDCIRLFMKEEELADEEKPTCTKCKTRRACTKSFSIQRFPKILVFHLKRFSQEKYGRKLSTTVEYPVFNLDLSEYAAERGGNRILYNLYAVSNHSGGVHSGHYTAICKHPYTGEWHSFNDTRVSPARSNQAVSSEGYLLFYEQASQSGKL